MCEGGVVHYRGLSRGKRVVVAGGVLVHQPWSASACLSGAGASGGGGGGRERRVIAKYLLKGMMTW